MMNTREQHLVQTAFAAAQGHVDWCEVADALSRTCGARSCNFGGHDLALGRAWLDAPHMEESAQKTYVEHYWRHNYVM